MYLLYITVYTVEVKFVEWIYRYIILYNNHNYYDYHKFRDDIPNRIMT